MKALYSALLASCFLLISCIDQPTQQSASSGNLVGSWTGYETGHTDQWTFIFTQAEARSICINSEVYRATYKTNTQTDPKQIDIIITQCSDPSYVGKVTYGIYKIEGNTLFLNANEPGDLNRPATFSSGRGYILTGN